MESFQMVWLQPKEQFQTGKLEINSIGQYTVNDHVLSEGEIVSIFCKGKFREVSIHFNFQNMYAIGAAIELGDLIKYELDL